MNWKTALASLAVLFASLALAEDFKTINGKEYKNAKVSRVEPDGIVLITKGGISKVYFMELPQEVQKRFNYDPVKAAQFGRATQAASAQSNVAAATEKTQQEALAQLQKYRIEGYVQRKTNDGLILKLSNLIGHNASDIPAGIKNPMSEPGYTQGFNLVFIRGYPHEENLADGNLVDVIAYDSGTYSSGTSTYRSYTFYSR
jgi:hypothetical protein